MQIFSIQSECHGCERSDWLDFRWYMFSAVPLLCIVLSFLLTPGFGQHCYRRILLELSREENQKRFLQHCTITMWTSRTHLPTIQHVGRACLSTFRSHQNPRGSSKSLRSQPARRTIRRNGQPSSSSHPPRPEQQQSPGAAAGSAANPNYDPAQNTLLAPVHIPEDPSATLREGHPAANILTNSGLVVQRQLEMMNVMM